MASESIVLAVQRLGNLIPGLRVDQYGSKWYLTVDGETMAGALGPTAAAAALEFAANLIESGKLRY